MDNPIFGKLEFVQQIGKGNYANVWKVYSTKFDTYFVAKIEHVENEETKNEYDLHRMINHPLVCQFYDSQIVSGQKVGILSYIEGKNLLQVVNSQGIFSEHDAKIIMLQLISIFRHLHDDLKIVHRDIKCENIILDNNGNVNLIDFGFAIKIDDKCKETFILGSPEYMSPEIIRNEFPTPSVDIWSLGIVLYAITLGELPFKAKSKQKLFYQICNSPALFSEKASPELRDLIEKTIDKDKNARITLAEMINHPWFTINVNRTILKPSFTLLETMSVLPKKEDEIDNTIIKQLSSLFNVANVNKYLINNESRPETAIYKFLRMEKLLKDLKMLRGSLFKPVTINKSGPLPLIPASQILPMLKNRTKVVIPKKPGNKLSAVTHKVNKSSLGIVKPIVQQKKCTVSYIV